MFTTETKRKTSKPSAPDRYKRFEMEKRRIPMNITPHEYEQEVKRLARKYKI